MAELPEQPIPPTPTGTCSLPGSRAAIQLRYHLSTGAAGGLRHGRTRRHGCHTANLAFMANKLEIPNQPPGRSGGSEPADLPSWASVVYEFPAAANCPRLVYCRRPQNGQKEPSARRALSRRSFPRPRSRPTATSIRPDSGSIIVGERRHPLFPNGYGADYKLFPEERFPTTTSLRRKHSAHRRRRRAAQVEWIAAIKAAPRP